MKRTAEKQLREVRFQGTSLRRLYSSGLIVLTPLALNKDDKNDWLSDKWIHKSPGLLASY